MASKELKFSPPEGDKPLGADQPGFNTAETESGGIRDSAQYLQEITQGAFEATEKHADPDQNELDLPLNDSMPNPMGGKGEMKEIPRSKESFGNKPLSEADQKIADEITQKNDFMNVRYLTVLNRDLSYRIGSSGGESADLLDVSNEENKETLDVIAGQRTMKAQEGLADEYDTHRVLRLGIIRLDDPIIAEDLTHFKGAIQTDQLIGGSSEALKVLFSHPGPLTVRNLDPEHTTWTAIGALIDRGRKTPAPKLETKIFLYKDMIKKGIVPEDLAEEIIDNRPDLKIA